MTSGWGPEWTPVSISSISVSSIYSLLSKCAYQDGSCLWGFLRAHDWLSACFFCMMARSRITPSQADFDVRLKVVSGLSLGSYEPMWSTYHSHMVLKMWGRKYPSSCGTTLSASIEGCHNTPLRCAPVASDQKEASAPYTNRLCPSVLSCVPESWGQLALTGYPIGTGWAISIFCA